MFEYIQIKRKRSAAILIDKDWNELFIWYILRFDGQLAKHKDVFEQLQANTEHPSHTSYTFVVYMRRE